jgi:hypothetical protein
MAVKGNAPLNAMDSLLKRKLVDFVEKTPGKRVKEAQRRSGRLAEERRAALNKTEPTIQT